MDDATATLTARDGTPLFTRRWPAPDPWGAVLVVHGIAEHSGRYDHVARRLTARGLSVYAFDLRGHGRSGGRRVDVSTFARYADDLAFVATEEVVPLALPWAAYGHSMGGLIVAGYLLDGRRPVPDAAVLSAPALDAEVPGALRIAAEVFGRLAPGLRFSNAIRGDQLSRDPAVGEVYFADPLVVTKTTARLGRALFREQARLRERLGDLPVPTLVIHGGADELVPPAASAPLETAPRVERTVYPNLRHELHNEPEGGAVLDDVVRWLGARWRHQA